MKTEKQSCCLCFGVISGGNLVDSDILDLLKYLIVNMDTSTLENSTICDGCLNKVVETCRYKRRNSSKMIMETKKEIDSEKPITCQKCEKVCEQSNTFSLMDCVTQIDWSDFVGYLFVDQDSQSLESLQICDSCRISVSDIQDFLNIIYVFDKSKMKCDIETCDDIKTTGNQNLVEVQVKNEFENFSVDDKTKIGDIIKCVKTEIENVIEDNKTEICDDYINYVDFKCKNEEVDLKLEYNRDESQSTNQYEKADGKEMISNGGSTNSLNNEEEELGVNSQKCTNRLGHYLKVHNNIRDFKCIYCSKRYVNKLGLDNHLLKIHKRRDGVTSKIHDCDKCNFATTKKSHMLRHSLIHGIKIGLQKYKCQNCIYETYDRNYLIRHMKRHNDIQDFKCSVCSKYFTLRRNLEDHLLTVHKNKDNVTSKIHNCDRCGYETINIVFLLRHKLKHGIKVEGLEKYECQNCIYETYNKYNLIRHIKTHNNVRDFKCDLCSRNFTYKTVLNEHLLKVHKMKDNVTSKIHECDRCSYETTNMGFLLKHKLKHDIKVEKKQGIKIQGVEKYKCQNCIYETGNKNNLIRHIKSHKNIQDFKCSLCTKKFTSKKHLDDHLLKIHKSKDNVTSKIHECEKCSYKTTVKIDMMRHSVKHGVKIEGLKKHKCQYCIFETYYKNNLNVHLKKHKNIHDFKCILCSKHFSRRKYLDNHLLKVHKSKDNVLSEIHGCDN